MMHITVNPSTRQGHTIHREGSQSFHLFRTLNLLPVVVSVMQPLLEGIILVAESTVLAIHPKAKHQQESTGLSKYRIMPGNKLQGETQYSLENP